jgi:hypothetical protein
MSAAQVFRRRSLALWLSLLVLSVALAGTASAQNVTTVSAILTSTNSKEIDTYSATTLDDGATFYYGVATEGYLFHNGSEIKVGVATDPVSANGYMTAQITVGPDEQYTLSSDHFVVAQVVAVADGVHYWENPSGFAYSTNIATGDTEVSKDVSPGGGPSYFADCQYGDCYNLGDLSINWLHIIGTAVGISSAAPSISGIDTNAAPLNGSGTITVTGTALVDVFTGQASPAIDGSGVTLSVQSLTATRVVLSYTVALTANTGPHQLTLSTRFGTSNAVTFTVGDRTPVMAIDRNAWNAGTSFTLTITGSGFGANPTLTITGPSVTSVKTTQSDTQITATVSVDSLAPSGSATVTVKSNGYNGTGFVPWYAGQPTSVSTSATIQPIPAPIPQIIFNGTNVAGTVQQVVAGQQIALSAVVPGLSGNLFVQSQGWTSPSGSVTGGYCTAGNCIPLLPAGYAIPTGGCTIPLPLQTLPSDCAMAAPSSLTAASYLFYWFDLGAARAMTYSYTLNNGTGSSAFVTFNVGGLDRNAVVVVATPVPGGPGINPPNVNIRVPQLAYGGVGAAGMDFLSRTAAPSGMYQWVQILNTVTATTVSSVGQGVQPLTGAAPVLDNNYPYSSIPGAAPQNNETRDSPKLLLPQQYGQLSYQFDATMNLLWDPALGPANCAPAVTVYNAATKTYVSTPSSCTSIPIPLASATWGFCEGGINTLQPVVTNGISYVQWVQSCVTTTPGAGAPAFTVSSYFPKWNSVSAP